MSLAEFHATYEVGLGRREQCGSCKEAGFCFCSYPINTAPEIGCKLLSIIEIAVLCK